MTLRSLVRIHWSQIRWERWLERHEGVWMRHTSGEVVLRPGVLNG